MITYILFLIRGIILCNHGIYIRFLVPIADFYYRYLSNNAIHGILTDLLIPEYSSQPRQTMSVWFEKQISLFHRLYL